MTRCWILAVVVLALGLGVPCTANEGDPKGSLVIIGGALRFGDRTVWEKITELAGGEGATIAVFPTASNQPHLSYGRIARILERVGARPFLVPVALDAIDIDYREAVRDPELVEKVRSAQGVFFTGGSQARITAALLTETGEHTPLLDAVWDVYRRGGVVAGTSAGAAMMSRTMFANPRSVLGMLTQGVELGRDVDRGLGFLDRDWFVEQHCLVRGRFARALVAMHSQGMKYGIGVDEDTAVVVRNGRELEVCGYKGALVFNISEATHDSAITKFNLRNVKLTYLDHGDAIDLKTLAITPCPAKREGGHIDPNAADFMPQSRRQLFTNDILGNATVVELMWQLLGNANSEAIGLAYDGNAARKQATDGFEFRFYRGEETHGWYTDEYGSDAYTICNMRLDIRPVMISGPLYRYDAEPPTLDSTASAEDFGNATVVPAAAVSSQPAATTETTTGMSMK